MSGKLPNKYASLYDGLLSCLTHCQIHSLAAHAFLDYNRNATEPTKYGPDGKNEDYTAKSLLAVIADQTHFPWYSFDHKDVSTSQILLMLAWKISGVTNVH